MITEWRKHFFKAGGHGYFSQGNSLYDEIKRLRTKTFYNIYTRRNGGNT